MVFLIFASLLSELLHIIGYLLHFLLNQYEGDFGILNLVFNPLPLNWIDYKTNTVKWFQKASRN